MRRVLLGGLVGVIGMMAAPAVAQERPAAGTRAAQLGRPVAIPDADPANVTPAGLFSRGQTTPGATVPQPMQPGTTGTPMPGVAQPGGTVLPPPRPVGTPNPSVTEMRDPAGRIIPQPGATMGTPVVVPNGTPMPGGAVLVPSVGPGGVPVLQPTMDDPLFGAGPTEFPGFPALNRLATPGKFWATGEYLLWWTRSAQLPTLVTTSSPQYRGYLGVGDTQSVFGDQSFGQSLHSGARFGGGMWFGDQQCRGIDSRFFFLGQNGNEFTVNSGQVPVLARPFFNINGDPALLPTVTGIRPSPIGPLSELVALPGFAMGGVGVQLQNDLWGYDINYRRALAVACNGCGRLDGLIGFRGLTFNEQLTITESIQRVPGSDMTIGSPAIGAVVTDSFRTENNFYGGQIGLTGELRRGRWSVDGRATIAFGQVFQKAIINGSQVVAYQNGGVAQFQGGLLALPGANIGEFTQNKFAVLPEIGVNIGYNVTPHLRVFVGYNFLYLSSVLRPGNVIDTAVDAARIPNFGLPATPVAGYVRPAPQLRTTDFFAQGISFGLQWSW